MGQAGRQADVDERALLATPDDVWLPVPVTARPEPALPAEAVFPRVTERRSDLRTRLRVSLDVEVRRGGRFLLVPVLLGLGAIAYFLAPWEPSAWMPVVGAAVALAAAFFCGDGSPVRLAFLAAGLLACGTVFAQIETWRMDTRMLGAEITTRLIGTVLHIDHADNGRVRLTIALEKTERPTLRYAPERVRLGAREAPAGLIAGGRVEGVARLFPPSGPVRPHGYDFAFESYFDGRGATGFFLTNPVLLDAAPAGLYETAGLAVERFRDRMAARIQTAIGGPEGEIAAALVTGVRGGIPEEVNEDLRITGLAHVLSISGLHMALVALTVMGSIRAVGAAFPLFASRRALKKYAAGAALIVTALYLLVSGAEVAAQRSFVMLAVMLVALLFDQAAISMRNLAIAAILILIVAPHEIMGPSFQMSFAATAALVAAYGWWAERRESQPARSVEPRGAAGRVGRKIILYALGLAATSLVAGAATTLFAAWHFQRMSPLSLAANLAAMPFVSVMVMPFAVVSVVLMPFGLDGPFLAVMGKGISAMLAIAHWFAVRSPFDAVGQIPPAAFILCTIGLVVLALATTPTMRVLAVPFALAGLSLLLLRDLPDVYVTEDARLVAVRTADGRLAVNRLRPNGFAMENWQRAAVAGRVVKPEANDSSGDRSSFACADGLCTIETGSGLVVHAQTQQALARACAVGATLIVIEDASVDPTCEAGSETSSAKERISSASGENPGVAIAAAARAEDAPGAGGRIISARELARQGAAEVRLKPSAPVHLRFAVAEPLRPWHAHRAYSRAARGLRPWQPRPKVGKEQDIPRTGRAVPQIARREPGAAGDQ